MAAKRDVAEVRELMEELADRLADLSDEAQEALLEQSSELVATMKDRAGRIMERARATGRRVDTYAHEEPWKVAAGAAVVGGIIGYLLASRRH
ncbi:DUF883 family protein [Candidatus Berkelbacteria bacterium]|nr:DUF883 family protein [Candidatus Berkelbacteria bacterium]